MPEGNGTAIDVQPGVVEVKLAVTGQQLSGKCFVKFNQVRIRQFYSMLLLELPECRNRTDAHAAWIDSSARGRQHSGKRLQAVPFKECPTGEQDGRCPVCYARSIACGNGSIGGKDRLELRHFLDGRLPNRVFVTHKDLRALLAFNRNRNDFRIEASTLQSTLGSLLRAQCILILLLARDLELACEHLGCFSH